MNAPLSETWTLIATQPDLERLVQTLRSHPAIAVDTESNSLYAYQERVCLIQISIPDVDYIVDPLAPMDLSPLGEIFADPKIQKVFHAAEQDIAGLKRDFGFPFANLFDTMRAARILGWPRVGLADLLQERFGVYTNKRFQRYNWGLRPLSPEALAYAALDTRYLLPLRDMQVRELVQRCRMRQATETFERLTRIPPAAPHYGPQAFWRVRDVYSLDERDRAVLWQLYLWRDRVAREGNRPPFRVMSDEVLIRLVRTRPHTPAELATKGRLPDPLIRRYGQAILEAIRRGERSPAPSPPCLRHPEDATERYQALRAWRRRVAEARGVDPDAILPSTVLWALAERAPQTMRDLEEMDDLGPWARETWGPEIIEVLRQCMEKSSQEEVT